MKRLIHNFQFGYVTVSMRLMDPSPELRMTAVSALAGLQPGPVTN
ncbi:MAG TPA: hypothetical protein VJ396_02860 [Acidiferrobacterales bacterium]|nr:hypothetical protein [Acidiferrobacterales bacterium]